eukprot:TRINITY_DN14657_c0_g1_i1.p1 TRINITY_DN14657_c0_g1~~TRINITY_DN14657_c0_g1_i1.p1  ORF type:complete len:133 (-),score=34.20 TRINITY_DN14657_c0_g1_i1:90-431(-)
MNERDEEVVGTIRDAIDNCRKTNHFNFRNVYGMEDAKLVLEAIKCNSKLKAISFHNSSLWSAGIKCLRYSLLISASLTHLDISGNSIGSKGFKCFLKYLPFNLTIRTLIAKKK